MQTPKKTIKIFLLDGDPNGRMVCELSNWTGKAYKIPRNRIRECSDREDLTGTGVYLLLGKDEEANDLVYIGEGEEILKRIIQHLPEKGIFGMKQFFLSAKTRISIKLILSI